MNTFSRPDPDPAADCNSNPACDCHFPGTKIVRRGFLKQGSLAATAVALAKLPVMAGPFDDVSEYRKVIPEDKRLDPAWIRSLYERGEKDVYSDPHALAHIGMPVGGFFTGTVYLAGDGRLWLWDIFNRDQEGIAPRDGGRPFEHRGQVRSLTTREGLNYVSPAAAESPLEQGFTLQVQDKSRPLSGDGFSEVTFDGRYPIGKVTYRDQQCPVEVQLEAFSPFIPLSLDDSSLPVVVMSYTLTNRSKEVITATLSGHLENPICVESRKSISGQRHNRIVREAGFAAVVCSATPQDSKSDRLDILFEDFEHENYQGWTVEGEAFGTGPVARTNVPAYQGDLGGKGRRVVNSHASAAGESIDSKDGKTGKLVSKPFTISRKFINFYVGGGAHKERTCINVLVDGNIVASVSGRDNNRMQPHSVAVESHQGKTAQMEIVDRESGSWGNIGVDHIVFSDRPAEAGKLTERPDFGTMSLMLLGDSDLATASAADSGQSQAATGSLNRSLVGRISRQQRLEPGASATLTFALTWHFPNFYSRGCGNQLVGHHYATRFESAIAVGRYLATDYQRLADQTRQWVRTWYDSTLPYWLLDRTMANTSTLATATCYRFGDGRFWAWEGIGCCPGTCTHVWHYAQAAGRLFPELERIERERVNFALGLHADGGIGMRTSLTGSNHAADDGQCGRILGALREHQMSTDDAFLRRLWPNIRKALLFMIERDNNNDGILEGAQPNTLDAAWFGKISFISSLYLAALRAGQQMAIEMGDEQFARRCKTIADEGSTNILETFNGEYFRQLEDPEHAEAIGVGNGCYIDQVFGQTWAHWIGLGRLFDRDKQLSALRALWKYNFVPDVGPFREQFQQGRWYAVAGDAGLVMCTWPQGGKRDDWQKHWQFQYFNECMSGFEYQAASHMVWEGLDQPDLLQHGLAITRAVHDRYNAALRNPYNEIECSDHYSRAMASFGVYQAVCGYQYHGPKGQLEFAPRLTPEDFRCAFTTAEGWGTFSQTINRGQLGAEIKLHWGTLRLTMLALQLPSDRNSAEVQVTAAGNNLSASVAIDRRRAEIRLPQELRLQAGQSIEVSIT